MAKPLKAGEFFVHKIRLGQAGAFESLVQLGGARLDRPLEFKIRKDPREFSEVGLVSALVGAGPGEQYDGVMVYNSEGKPIGKISLPERCANLCFGGRRRNRLFMAASQSIYALYVNTRGAR